MKRELGIAPCGLACCLCSENDTCPGCRAEGCRDKDWCENRKCAGERGLEGCWQCADLSCRKGLLVKDKPYGFTKFARKHGVDKLLRCLEENEARGVVYHREGITGDYDGIENFETLERFLLTGDQTPAPLDRPIGRCGFYCGCCPNYVNHECEGCVPAHQSGDCYTRDCVEQKGVTFCPQCPEFPCKELLHREHATVLDREWLSWMGRRKEER